MKNEFEAPEKLVTERKNIIKKSLSKFLYDCLWHFYGFSFAVILFIFQQTYNSFFSHLKCSGMKIADTSAKIHKQKYN